MDYRQVAAEAEYLAIASGNRIFIKDSIFVKGESLIGRTCSISSTDRGTAQWDEELHPIDISKWEIYELYPAQIEADFSQND